MKKLYIAIVFFCNCWYLMLRLFAVRRGDTFRSSDVFIKGVTSFESSTISSRNVDEFAL